MRWKVTGEGIDTMMVPIYDVVTRTMIQMLCNFEAKKRFEQWEWD